MVQLEAKHFPLVLLDLGGSERAPDQLRQVFAGFHDVNRRARTGGRRWALVAVTASPPNALERKIIAEESNKFSDADQALSVAHVLVIPNGVIRSVVTALGWLMRSKAPLTAAPTTDAAVDVAVDRLRAIGLDIPQREVVQAKHWFLRNESMPKVRVAGVAKGG